MAGKQAEAANQESIAYPKSNIEYNALHIKFSLRSASPVKTLLFNEKGVILQQLSEKSVAKGLHNFTFSLENMRHSELSQVFYKLLTNEHNESKKNLLVK
jgi:hypothetical protein